MTTGPWNAPLAIVMVGLPARGKTYVARRLSRYLGWLGHRARVFNVGNYRRERLGGRQAHDFFDPKNPEGQEARLRMALAALDDLIAWFADGGEVGIYDATNSSQERRNLVQERCARHGIDVLFVESICHDEAIIDGNVRETKLGSPDYIGMDPAEAVRDFRARIAHYEQAYETVDDPAASWIKLIDVGRRIEMNRIHGYLPARLVFFLMNLHITPRPIWLCRHGESEYNQNGRIGGDSALSPRGREYAKNLGQWLDTYARSEEDITIWTSSLQRATETASYLSAPSRPWKALDEIDAGSCDGLTYAQIAERFPDEYAARSRDKFRYRYPRGESYEDVIQRLEPVMIELERQRSPVLVIAHQAVIRALYAYFLDHRPTDCPRLSVPLHTVIELTPKAYTCVERQIFLGPPTD